MRELGEGRFHITMHEIHESNSSLYLIMDYCNGGELLKQIPKMKNINERVLKKTIKNLLKGLQYVHSKGIMHRDLKPENLILAEKRILHKIKIIDFGLATFVDQKVWLFKRCGTPGYVAPEVYEKGER